MIKKTKNQIIFILITLIFIIGMFYVLFENPLDDEKINFNNTGSLDLSGEIQTISQNNNIQLTGNVSQGGEISPYDDFIALKNIGNIQSFYPEKQPIPKNVGLMSFSERSAILNNYLSTNTFIFRVPVRLEKGYLDIKFKQKPVSNIFIYWHNSKISGRLLINKPLYKISSTEYLFGITNIPILKYPGYTQFVAFNRFSDLQYYNKANYIAAYIADFNGNYITEISIVYKFIN